MSPSNSRKTNDSPQTRSADSCGLLCGRSLTIFDLFLTAGISVVFTYVFLSTTGRIGTTHDVGYNASALTVARYLEGGWMEHDIVVVTDLDTESKDKSGKKWHSTGRHGVLRFNPNEQKAEVSWVGEDYLIASQLASGGRAMELSDLAVFDGKLVTVDDRTGILYHLIGNQVYPWVLLNDGPGNTTKTLKGEWLTEKDGELYVGGLGKEWTTTTGEYVNDNPMWVKVVSRHGAIRHVPWKDAFIKVRRAVGIEYPGYMIHEAVQWSEVHRRWFFLPRRASTETYSEEADETRGTNTMIIANEDFSDIRTVHVGTVDDARRGFSAFQFVPNTGDSIIVALKSAEKDGIPVASYISVFDVHGNVLLDDQSLEEAHKFEGIAFA